MRAGSVQKRAARGGTCPPDHGDVLIRGGGWVLDRSARPWLSHPSPPPPAVLQSAPLEQPPVTTTHHHHHHTALAPADELAAAALLAGPRSSRHDWCVPPARTRPRTRRDSRLPGQALRPAIAGSVNTHRPSARELVLGRPATSPACHPSTTTDLSATALALALARDTQAGSGRG